MQYIDIHSHLNFGDLEDDLEAVLERMRLSETGTIVVGTDYESSEKAVRLAEGHENIWASIGIHPVDDPRKEWEEEKFSELAKSSKVVAIGECGLDFFHAKPEEDLERQRKLFLDQAHFALRHDLPLMIHSRAGYNELLEVLESLKKEHGNKLRGDVHFFTGDLEQAKRFWALAFTTSFTGVITFPTSLKLRGTSAENYIEVIKQAPIEMIMAETDSPFVAPAPYRGKRNEPSYVQYIVAKITEIRGEDLETIKKALVSNAERMFKISA